MTAKVWVLGLMMLLKPNACQKQGRQGLEVQAWLGRQMSGACLACLQLQSQGYCSIAAIMSHWSVWEPGPRRRVVAMLLPR